MRTFISILVCGLLTGYSTLSQEKNEILRNLLSSADSIMLVSHTTTNGVQMVEDSSGKPIPLPKLVINGRPNEKIIKEQTLISGKYLDTLISILVRPFQDKEISEGMCFIPHHSIFVFTNSRISFLEICFQCRRFETSKDLEFIYAFDERKWLELEGFFLARGFKYEIEP